MEVEFANDDLDQLEVDPKFTGNYAKDAIRGFRKVMGLIRAAEDERDLRSMKSLRFEKLKGNRKHQSSLRLNKQWRLIVEVIPGKPKNTIRVIDIEDYH